MKELYEALEEAIHHWPSHRIRPSNGKLEKDGYCCIGARLAMLADLTIKHKYLYYLQGIDNWIQTVNGNRLHAILLLRQAGAGHDPLAGEGWETIPERVIKNLKKIEELPNIKGENFSNCSLTEIELKDLDLSGTSFYWGNMKHSKLENIIFNNCDFRSALLYGSTVENCEFKNAKIEDAWIEKATFKNSSLRDTVGTPLK